MIKRLRSIYQEYPQIFWFVMLGMFIDQLGGALIYPFFGLYITSKYNVGMTEVGVLFSIFAITGLVGSLIGGAVEKVSSFSAWSSARPAPCYLHLLPV
jgi:predicted MFS family arabinose efflux permease